MPGIVAGDIIGVLSTIQATYRLATPSAGNADLQVKPLPQLRTGTLQQEGDALKSKQSPTSLLIRGNISSTDLHRKNTLSGQNRSAAIWESYLLHEYNAEVDMTVATRLPVGLKKDLSFNCLQPPRGWNRFRSAGGTQNEVVLITCS